MSPLYDSIDPDALDRLVGATLNVQVAFEYEGHHVTLHSNGSARVTAPPEVAAD